MSQSEVDQLLDGNNSEETNLLDQPLNGDGIVTPPVQDDQDDEEPKNRAERRLREKLQAEREANIALAARLEAISEAKKDSTESSEFLKSVDRIYGTDTPEAQAATEVLKNALEGAVKEARKAALEDFREEQRREAAQVKEEESKLDSFVEEIEDANGITMTKEMQTGFFTLLEKMSPKDSEGNITAYADPHSVWEIFTERNQKKTDNRAKQLASRSMVQSGSEGGSNLQSDATERMLREAGIL